MSEGRFLKGWERMRVHTGKGVLLGSEGGDEGILLFLGRARRESWLRDWFGRRWRSDHSRRRHNLHKGFTVKEGEVLLPGELWWTQGNLMVRGKRELKI